MCNTKLIISKKIKIKSAVEEKEVKFNKETGKLNLRNKYKDVEGIYNLRLHRFVEF